MSLIRRSIAVVALVSLSAAVLAGQQQTAPISLTEKIDSICEKWDVTDAPGGVVGIVKDGKMIFAKAYGLANVENGVPNTVNTLFDVGSVSKQFTAMCVLILEDRGELSIDDPVSKHFSGIPAAKNGMTIKQLMQHTSGIRDYFGLMAISGQQVFDNDDVMDVLRRQIDTNFPPGQAFSYSNTGYFLLAELVEQISGESLREFAKENVFEPLGMNATVFQDDFRQLIMHKAYGYVESPEDGLLAGVVPLAVAGAGGLITTLHDMMLWTENWKHNKLGPQSVIERMQTKAKLASGDESSYGLALFIDDLDGVDRVQHGGDFIGFHAQVSTFPEHDLAVYTFGNDGTQLAKSINDKIARYLLADVIDPEEALAAKGEIELTAEEIKEYVGRYNLLDRAVMEFLIDEGKLKIQVTGQPKIEIFCSEKDHFFLKVVEATAVFNRDEEGAISSITFSQGGQTFELSPMDPFELSDEDIKTLSGRYYSVEMEVVLTVFERDGELWAKTDKFMDPTKIEMVVADRGSLSPFTLQFERKDGKVTAVFVSIMRSNNIRFNRMSADWGD
ncbi:MAG: serine hydrolase [Armatimonadetes bacterium]|nr:serine hydrolase [Armatimonadota bacterium]